MHVLQIWAQEEISFDLATSNGSLLHVNTHDIVLT
jgi:hypothetical protein